MANLFDPSSASFVTGVPTSSTTGWVVMAMDDLAAQEIEHSAILRYRDGVFEATCLKMFKTRTALHLPERDEALFIGDDGQCTAIDASGIDRDEYVTNSERRPRNTGHLRDAARLGDEVIAVGMQRQVYWRDALGMWSDMMQGLPQEDDGVSGFECVLPVSRCEMYAAGWRGEVWRFDGTTWGRVESSTNQIITAMCLDATGTILACGRNGLLLAGRHDAWQVVHEGACPVDLWSIDASTGRTFVAGLRHLFSIDQGRAQIETTDAQTFGELSYDAGVLWSFGQKDFLMLDGTVWKRLY